MDTNDDLAAANLYDGDTPGEAQPAYDAGHWWQETVGRHMPAVPLLTDRRDGDVRYGGLKRHRAERND